MKKPTKYHSTVIITAALTTAAIGGTALAKTLDIEILDLAPPDGTVREVRLSGPAVKLFEGTFPESILVP